MNSLRSKVVFLLTALLSIGSLAASRGSQDRQGTQILLSTNLVLVDAQALNKKTGRTVDGLTRDDFVLYEDGVKQLVTHFSQDKLPLSVVLLLDVTVSRRAISRIQDGGLQAFPLNPEDELALMAFDEEAAVIQPFSRDKQLVADKINNPAEIISLLHGNRKGPVCEKHIGDSIYQAALYLRKAANPSGRRTIVVLTDNEPYETKIAHSKQEVVNQLFETGVVVHGLTLPPGYEDYIVNKIVGRLPLTWFLVKLYNKGGKVDYYADATGGVVLKSGNEKAEERLVDLISQLRTSYSFGYVSSNQNKDGKFRKIQLKVSPGAEKREGKIAVLTRKGYYAPKAESTDDARIKKPR